MSKYGLSDILQTLNIFKLQSIGSAVSFFTDGGLIYYVKSDDEKTRKNDMVKKMMKMMNMIRNKMIKMINKLIPLL
jgi:hypothetical protein